MPENQPQIPAPEQPLAPQSNTTPAVTEAPPAAKSSFGVQMLLGLGAFLLLLVGIGSLIILISLRPRGFLPNLVWPLIPTALGVFLLVRRARRGPGLWVGFLLGLGIVGLAAGICVSMINSVGIGH
jgi:hypothetical protein